MKAVTATYANFLCNISMVTIFGNRDFNLTGQTTSKSSVNRANTLPNTLQYSAYTY